jgi:hypothetical protein
MYELWDRASSNQLGEFGTKREAVAAYRAIVRADPPARRTLVLLHETPGGVLRRSRIPVATARPVLRRRVPAA